jgi:teichuronic acid biosynthesis glycosyltransferase TuaC
VADALRRLSGSQPRTLLAIAGGPGREGNYESEIRAAVQELPGGAVFLGHLDAEELAHAMSAADVFCLASRQEGWPNVVHEAMACGLPIVATDVGGLREMVPEERFGRVVGFGDEAALSCALDWALGCDWDRSAITAWAHSRSWNQVAREVLQELEAVHEKAARERHVDTFVKA